MRKPFLDISLLDIEVGDHYLLSILTVGNFEINRSLLSVCYWEGELLIDVLFMRFDLTRWLV